MLFTCYHTNKYKILVYPNETFQKDLEKDSYVVVLRNVINELNKVQYDNLKKLLFDQNFCHEQTQSSYLYYHHHNPG